MQRDGVHGHTDFRVRRDKVIAALRWLKLHNQFYSSIEIDLGVANQLPTDGDVSRDVAFIHEGGIDDEACESDNITETAVPMNAHQRQEEAITSRLQWPEGSSIPINEFRTAGYITMAFPCLFPDGEADYTLHHRDIRVTYHDWCDFLIHYSDPRFATDPRFRFHCINTLQRHDALTRSTIFAKKSDFTGNMQQLAAEVSRNPSLLKRLLSWGSNIRGTNAYWFQRRQELEAMVNQLGIPTLFLTLSSADLWWPCMTRHFGLTDEYIATLTEKQLSKLMQEKLNENPLIADAYFTKRVDEFLAILKKKFNIADYWMRFEYQFRGSPHLHALIWIDGAPDVRSFDNATTADIESHRVYYDTLVSAMNPNMNEPPADVHPSRVKCSSIEIGNVRQQAQLLNKVQRHTRCSRQCKKPPRNECRFNYPKALLTESTLSKDEKGHWQFLPKRNDELLDDHNIFAWMMATPCSRPRRRRSL